MSKRGLLHWRGVVWIVLIAAGVVAAGVVKEAGRRQQAARAAFQAKEERRSALARQLASKLEVIRRVEYAGLSWSRAELEAELGGPLVNAPPPPGVSPASAAAQGREWAQFVHRESGSVFEFTFVDGKWTAWSSRPARRPADSPTIAVALRVWQFLRLRAVQLAAAAWAILLLAGLTLRNWRWGVPVLHASLTSAFLAVAAAEADPGHGWLAAKNHFVWMGLGMLAVSGLFLSLALRREHRRRQRLIAEGICLSCGYDLRASPGRCPECGVAAPVPTTSAAREPAAPAVT